MKKDIDSILKQALTPNDEPDFWLNQKILTLMKEEHSMKQKKLRKFAAVLSLVLVFGIGSVTAVAAWRHLTPDKAAEQGGNQKLADAFLSKDAVSIDETQSYGDYHITLLGIVSGKNISQYLTTADGNIHDDRTYSVVAVENADGTPMPLTSDDAYGQTTFFVSPLISGYNPALYNSSTMTGGYQDIVEDGILYRLSECDNVKIFADHDIYLCVTDSTFYNPDAYIYDEATGQISRNEAYSGVNALFDLPLDASKADPEAAEEYIKSIDSTADSGDDTCEETEIDRWMSQITPENIDEYARRIESTVQVITPDADGAVHYEYEVEGRVSGDGTDYVDNLFPDKKTGMSSAFSYSFSDDTLDTLVIHTFTWNEDGTVTFAIYIPREK